MNFNRLYVLGILLVILLGCSSNSTKNKIVDSKVAEVEEKWDYRIVGSSNISESQKSDGKTYFLYGAEHLGLDNYYFDIPVVYNKSVRKWMTYFLNKGRGFFERYSARAGRYAPVLGSILEKNGLPRDLIFLAMAESGFYNTAKSWAKAVGPWQFMPYTGKSYGLKISWYIDERRDPIKATIAASKYLLKLYKEFGSWELASAGYNAGEGKVRRAIKRYKTENFWKLRKGRYLKSETKNYVPKIMALAIIGKNLKAFGFEDIDFHEPLDFDEIKVPEFTDLMILSENLGVEFDEIKRLNPEVLRWFTPPKKDYVVRVPVGVKSKWEKCCANKYFKAQSYQTYRVRGRSSKLAHVARKFKIKPYVLMDINEGLKKGSLKRNDEILLPFRIGQSRKDQMYSDLYERPRKSVLRRRMYRSRIRLARRRGRLINNPSEYYTVRKGDTLWSVAQKKGVSLDTLIKSNIRLVKYRMIRAGDKLVVR